MHSRRRRAERQNWGEQGTGKNKRKRTELGLIASGTQEARNLRFTKTKVVERTIVGERRRSLNYS